MHLRLSPPPKASVITIHHLKHSSSSFLLPTISHHLNSCPLSSDLQHSRLYRLIPFCSRFSARPSVHIASTALPNTRPFTTCRPDGIHFAPLASSSAEPPLSPSSTRLRPVSTQDRCTNGGIGLDDYLIKKLRPGNLWPGKGPPPTVRTLSRIIPFPPQELLPPLLL